MVSVTNSQSTTALRLLQNTRQTSPNMEKLHTKTDAARIRPTAANNSVSRAMAKLTHLVMDSENRNIPTSGAKLIWTSNRTSTFGAKSTDNVGKGGETIISNRGGNISGGAGNDTIIAGTLNSVIHGGDGNDYIRAAGEIYGGKGNDTIDGQGKVYGGEGDDTITLLGRGVSGSTVYGGTGNDTINVRYGGDSTIEGGKGDDFIAISNQPNSRADGETATVRFNVGDGKDYIRATHSDVVLELGEGFTAENMKISYSEDGKTAIVTFDGNEDDQLTISNIDFRNQAASTFTIKFADGSTHELEELKPRYSR